MRMIVFFTVSPMAAMPPPTACSSSGPDSMRTVSDLSESFFEIFCMAGSCVRVSYVESLMLATTAQRFSLRVHARNRYLEVPAATPLEERAREAMQRRGARAQLGDRRWCLGIESNHDGVLIRHEVDVVAVERRADEAARPGRDRR